MLNRNALMLVAGAAIFALDASAASAQDTTRTRPTSTKRIPVTKESRGEVSLPKTDTVTMYRTDTLRTTRVDTVMNTVTNTVTRYDTVTKMVPMKLRQVGSLYWGVGVGSSLPAANFNDSDHPGWRVEVPFGIDPVGSPLGLRFNLGYGRYEPHSYVQNLANLDQAQMMNADADLKLRMLSGTPAGMHVQAYGVGGLSYNRYKGILENNNGVYNIGDVSGGASIPTNGDMGWHNGWGFNTGAGLEFGMGVTNVFVESRFVRFSGENSHISHVPIVVGLSFY
ncbi:MAG: hypothetical protein ABI442_18505 [Gemmatimonadaceae bacterium]